MDTPLRPFPLPFGAQIDSGTRCRDAPSPRPPVSPTPTTYTITSSPRPGWTPPPSPTVARSPSARRPATSHGAARSRQCCAGWCRAASSPAGRTGSGRSTIPRRRGLLRRADGLRERRRPLPDAPSRRHPTPSRRRRGQCRCAQSAFAFVEQRLSQRRRSNAPSAGRPPPARAGRGSAAAPAPATPRRRGRAHSRPLRSPATPAARRA
jgi:hypothetical protein